MTGRRRLRLVYLLGSLLALSASLHAPTAYAASGDPPAGSPSGAVYELPLQQGRADAAPKGGGGTGSGGNAGGRETGESGSLYRTENNFGSSSQVPGAPGSGGGGGASGGGAGASGAGGTGASGGSSSSAGGSAGGGASGGSALGSPVTDTGNTSLGDNVALLAAIGVAAVAIGIGSRRLAQRRRAVG